MADRLKDLRRHLDALRAAMASFGEDFDLALFQRAFESSEPDELNRVKAVERGVDQLYSYVARAGDVRTGARGAPRSLRYGDWVREGFPPRAGRDR